MTFDDAEQQHQINTMIFRPALALLIAAYSLLNQNLHFLLTQNALLLIPNRICFKRAIYLVCGSCLKQIYIMRYKASVTYKILEINILQYYLGAYFCFRRAIYLVCGSCLKQK
jgi:hypothetical protein